MSSVVPAPSRTDVFHHLDPTSHITATVEKNSKGVRWEISVVNAADPTDLRRLLDEAIGQLAEAVKAVPADG